MSANEELLDTGAPLARIDKIRVVGPSTLGDYLGANYEPTFSISRR
jgi:hypothetical protein